MKLIRPLGLLIMALMLMGAADGNLGWIEPFLSPALIVTVGLFIWREVRTSKDTEKATKAKESEERQALVERLTSIEQLLLGYQEKGGLLQQLNDMTNRSLDEARRRHDLANHVQLLQGAFEDAQIWMTLVGKQLDVPYERRHQR